MLIDIYDGHWKPTYIFSDYYLVSDDGRAYSVRSNKLLKFALDKDGYSYYVMCIKENKTI